MLRAIIGIALASGIGIWLILFALKSRRSSCFKKARPWLIVPLTKSPHSEGRLGLRERQDWFRALIEVGNIAWDKDVPDENILLISAFQAQGADAEVDIYRGVLRRFGIRNPRVFREGLETTAQINRAFEVAQEEDKNLLFVCTETHSWRVPYLISIHPWGKEAWAATLVDDAAEPLHKEIYWEVVAVSGLPRPKEAVTDFFLALLLPLLDVLEIREWFIKSTERRRAQGKH